MQKEMQKISKRPIKIKIIFSATSYFFSGIRELTLEVVKNMTKFPLEWAHRFQSIVDELCNNAVEHGSSDKSDITLSFIISNNETFEVVIEDTGTGKSKVNAKELEEILHAKQGIALTENSSIRGRGLSHIIAPLADKLIFEDRECGGIRIHVIKSLRKQ